MSCDENGKIDIKSICEYDYQSGTWHFDCFFSDEIINYGMESDAEAFKAMQEELKKLAAKESVT